MNITQPIKDEKELQALKNYYLEVHDNKRNYFLIILGLNTALRISDILQLRWMDIYDFQKNKVKDHLYIIEKKTQKRSCIFLNRNVGQALMDYKEDLSNKEKKMKEDAYVFCGQKTGEMPISRVQAFRIIKAAAQYCGIHGTISCHSLRKTFGYQAVKQGASPAVLMNIYNHSSYQITKRYLGIEQDDRDEIFKNIQL